MKSVSIALVHYPVLDSQGREVTSAITSLDVHDIARSARTYDCFRYYLVHPVVAQRDLVAKIREHWTTGSSSQRIPTRKEALRLVTPIDSLEHAIADLAEAQGCRVTEVESWVTTAYAARSVSYPDARARLVTTEKHVLLLLGTSWGLAEHLLESADVLLEPLMGRPGTALRTHSGDAPHFNHLSVRAACAIVLDRLLG
jgi:hypothetical protein